MDAQAITIWQESAYLVARGVRALALTGHCDAEPLEMLQVATEAERWAEHGAIAFVLDRGDGVADVGYAGAQWVIDLYRWTVTEPAADSQKHRILGLLLGYSVAAIRDHEEVSAGRMFEGPMISERDGQGAGT